MLKILKTRGKKILCPQQRQLAHMAMDRDWYGFKLPTTWVSIEELYQFDRGYKHILDRQASKWDTFLAEADNRLPPLCCKC